MLKLRDYEDTLKNWTGEEQEIMLKSLKLRHVGEKSESGMNHEEMLENAKTALLDAEKAKEGAAAQLEEINREIQDTVEILDATKRSLKTLRTEAARLSRIVNGKAQDGRGGNGGYNPPTPVEVDGEVFKSMKAAGRAFGWDTRKNEKAFISKCKAEGKLVKIL